MPPRKPIGGAFAGGGDEGGGAIGNNRGELVHGCTFAQSIKKLAASNSFASLLPCSVFVERVPYKTDDVGGKFNVAFLKCAHSVTAKLANEVAPLEQDMCCATWAATQVAKKGSSRRLIRKS